MSCGRDERQDPRSGAASHPDQHAGCLGRRKGAPRPYGSGLRPPLPPTGGSRTKAGCGKRPGVWRRTSSSVTASSSSRPEGGFGDTPKGRPGSRAHWQASPHCSVSRATLDAWSDELLACCPTGSRGVSNGPTGATNARRIRLPQIPDLPPATGARRRSGLAHRSLASCACHRLGAGHHTLC